MPAEIVRTKVRGTIGGTTELREEESGVQVVDALKVQTESTWAGWRAGDATTAGFEAKLVVHSRQRNEQERYKAPVINEDS